MKYSIELIRGCDFTENFVIDINKFSCVYLTKMQARKKGNNSYSYDIQRAISIFENI